MSSQKFPRLDKFAAICAVFTALGPLLQLTVWFLYHNPNGFYGFTMSNGSESLAYTIQHSGMWQFSTLMNMFSSLSFLFLVVYLCRLLHRLTPLWGSLLLFTAVINLTGVLIEQVIDWGIFPYLANTIDPATPSGEAVYQSMLTVSWLGFYLAQIPGSLFVVIASVVAYRYRDNLPVGWCIVGMIFGLMGFLSLEGAKVFRQLHSALAAIWIFWLAFLLFKQKFLPEQYIESRLQQ